MCRSYKQYRQQLVQQAKSKILRLSRFKGLRWRVDYVVTSSKISEINEPSVSLQLKYLDLVSSGSMSVMENYKIEHMGRMKNQEEIVNFDLTLKKFQVLHEGL